MILSEAQVIFTDSSTSHHLKHRLWRSNALKLLLLNGPNLNLLGEREPELYGDQGLREIEVSLSARASRLGIELICEQSNHEGGLIDIIHQHRKLGLQAVDGVIINPGGYTHTSVSLRDALIASQLPFIEIHLTNLAAREPFRQRSLISDVALGTIGGFGIYGYELALLAIEHHLKNERSISK